MMHEPHFQILFLYFAFMGIGTLLAFLRRWARPAGGGDNVWKKYPTYFLLNMTFLAAAWLPRDWHLLAFLIAAIGAGASWELSRGLRLSKAGQVGLPFITASLILAAEWLPFSILLKIWLASVLGATAIAGLASRREELGRLVIGLASCLIYLPACLATILWTWHMDGGEFLAAFLYMVIATNDAFAQFTGQLAGRRPLVPRISPAKTIEGAAGGIFFATLLGAALSSFIGTFYVEGALLGLGTSLAGLVGDLTESSWKRALGLKDFSMLLSAQGGVLDRFDSLIFASPFFFLFLNL